MSSNINRVFITGNLTRDPKLQNTPNGNQIFKFGVACNEVVKNNQTGEWTERPNFIDCTMFGKRAQAVAKYLTKGAKVAISGRLHYSAWDDKNTGQKRSKLDVTVTDIEFMSRGNGGQTQPAQQAQPAPASAYESDDIPF
jgi:single-strand DNA-binding protein